jgi:hypothetical protein
MNELIKTIVAGYKETKAKNEKWLAENEDLKDSTAYQFTLAGVALLDMGIAFWSSFLNTHGAG